MARSRDSEVGADGNRVDGVHRDLPRRPAPHRAVAACSRGRGACGAAAGVREMGHRPVPGQFRRLLQDLPESRLRADLPAVDLLRLGVDPAGRLVRFVDLGVPLPARSEEPTSELQSLMRLSYAVFCLKKKNTYIETNNALYYT